LTRSDHANATLSTYRFPDELRVDELWLRAPVEADLETVAPAFRDPAIGGEAGLPPVDLPRLREMLNEQLPQLHAAGRLSAFVVVDSRDDTILGGSTLHHFDPLRDAVEIGYWLFQHARGRGVATRAARAMVEHAFAHGVYRVEAHVAVGNSASERVLERLGFVREGTRRRFLRRAGGLSDATLFALLADDA